VTTSPSFATYWLVPRISRFQMDHPDIAIQLDLTAEERALDRADFDLAIRYGRADTLPADVDVLKSVTLNVVGPTNLLPPKPWTAEALSNLPWLQELGASEIKGWYHRHDAYGTLPKRISEMPGNLILEALKRGEAVSYVVCDWIEEDLARGSLRELWPEREHGAYYTIRPTPVAPPTATFLKWLTQDAEK